MDKCQHHLRKISNFLCHCISIHWSTGMCILSFEIMFITEFIPAHSTPYTSLHFLLSNFICYTSPNQVATAMYHWTMLDVRMKDTHSVALHHITADVRTKYTYSHSCKCTALCWTLRQNTHSHRSKPCTQNTCHIT